MTETVRVGYVLPSRELAVAGDLGTERLLALADMAASSGYDSLWVSDSPLGRARVDGLSLLAALAGRLPRMHLGTSVLIPALRHPVMLAYVLASLDRLAPGRLTLGAGVGLPGPALSDQFAAVGLAADRPFARMADTIAVCRRLWGAEGAVRPQSPFIDVAEPVDVQPRPSTPGGPPFWLGGTGPRARRLVARHLDGWMPYLQDASRFRDGWDEIRQCAADHGRPDGALSAAFVPTILIGQSRRTAGELREYCVRYYGCDPEELSLRRPGFFAGDTQACLEWLAPFVEAGARTVILRFATLRSAEDQLLRTAEHIIPALRRLPSGRGTHQENP
ncbi:LLM class flavin-dependent oxidoreductase [Dactylosporangium sp. CA-233914]|uniref:LLM class flavin-dependent oxidoreductase n=1 Tax=Dactylosporangium sp. CA-233914 TaxID=3239934 RepID=UPI003D8C4631